MYIVKSVVMLTLIFEVQLCTLGKHVRILTFEVSNDNREYEFCYACKGSILYKPPVSEEFEPGSVCEAHFYYFKLH